MRGFLRQNPHVSGPSAHHGRYRASGTGTVVRALDAWLNDYKTVKNYNAKADGNDDGVVLASAISDLSFLRFPVGTYTNTSTALSLTFAKTALFDAGASIANSGSGSFTANGGVIRYGYNPSSFASWNQSATGANYETLSADLGGYGTRDGNGNGAGTPGAVTGAINIPTPSDASFSHGYGVGAYAKSISTNTGAVALFGYAKSLATGVSAFGLNTVVADGGFQSVVYGAELDFNLGNASSVLRGIYLIGASSVAVVDSTALTIAHLGIGTSPKKAWALGYITLDGAISGAGLKIGSTLEANSGSQSLELWYRNAVPTSTKGFLIQVDPSGNTVINSTVNDVLLTLNAQTGGSAQGNIKLLAGFTGIGYSGVPAHVLDVGGEAFFRAGVAFPASQNSIADVNTLDDYEEGSWTPVVAFGGASVGITYGTQVGRYTKIGNVVFYAATIVLTSKGSSAGTAKITGVPFTPATITGISQAGAANFASMAATIISLAANIESATASIRLGNNNAGSYSDLGEGDFTNTTALRVSGHYIA